MFLRVRSLIIQQEKAQDREKLLLKFIKIMKVQTNFILPNWIWLIGLISIEKFQPMFFCIIALKKTQ